MLEVMNECKIINDLHIFDIETFSFLVKSQSGSYLTLKFNQFYNRTVEKFVCLTNLHKDYIIEIKC